jgi:hypothetical protein
MGYRGDLRNSVQPYSTEQYCTGDYYIGYELKVQKFPEGL